jgi:hypothetical protein
MKKNHGGYLMILAGVILFIGATFNLLAIVTVDTEPPLIYLYAPSGTITEPTPLTAGQYVDGIQLWITDAVDLAPSPAWVYVVNDATGETIDHVYLPYAGHTSLIDGYIWYKYERYDWKLPATVGGGTLVRFDFEATDNIGNVAYATGYGLTGTPDGHFEINGQIVDTDTHLYLNTRTLTFKFVATTRADEVETVEVTITAEDTTRWDVNMNKANATEWTGSWIAPSDGEYTIEGYIVPTYDPTTRFRKMTLFFDTGVEPGPPIPWIELVSFGLIGMGIVVVYKSKES